MNKLTIALLSAAALAGCTAEQTSQLQQQASAAIGGAHQVVQDSSAPLGELKQQASAALADTQIRQKLLGLGLQPSPGSSADFAGFIDSEVKKWGALVKARGIVLE